MIDSAPAVVVARSQLRRLRAINRFMENVRKDDDVGGCWVWIGPIKKENGYPQFRSWRLPGSRMAYRWLYELVVGPVPDGLELDHTCRRPICVNPDHLEPVTHAENMRRATVAHRALAVCRNGHPRTPENTYHPPGTPYLACRDCTRISQRAYRRQRSK